MRTGEFGVPGQGVQLAPPARLCSRGDAPRLCCPRLRGVVRVPVHAARPRVRVPPQRVPRIHARAAQRRQLLPHALLRGYPGRQLQQGRGAGHQQPAQVRRGPGAESWRGTTGCSTSTRGRWWRRGTRTSAAAPTPTTRAPLPRACKERSAKLWPTLSCRFSCPRPGEKHLPCTLASTAALQARSPRAGLSWGVDTD